MFGSSGSSPASKIVATLKDGTTQTFKLAAGATMAGAEATAASLRRDADIVATSIQR